MNNRLGGVLLAVLAVGAFACGESDLVAESKLLAGPMEEALASPSGTLDAASARAVLKNAFAPGPDPRNAFQLMVYGAPDACFEGEGTEGDPQEIDVDCATDGVLTGHATMAIEEEGDDIYTLIRYDEVCVADTDHCMSGDGALIQRLSANESYYENLLGNDVEIRRGSETTSQRFGLATVPPSGGAIYFINDESFVLGLMPIIDLENVSTTYIIAKNGEFDCEFTELGDHGKCEGPTSFVW